MTLHISRRVHAYLNLLVIFPQCPQIPQRVDDSVHFLFKCCEYSIVQDVSCKDGPGAGALMMPVGMRR